MVTPSKTRSRTTDAKEYRAEIFSFPDIIRALANSPNLAGRILLVMNPMMTNSVIFQTDIFLTFISIIRHLIPRKKYVEMYMAVLAIKRERFTPLIALINSCHSNPLKAK